MKLEGLRIFRDQLHLDLASQMIQSHIYYFHAGHWHDLDSEVHCSAPDSNNLKKAQIESVAYHATNSLSAWFYLPTGDCAVKLSFSKSPRLSTRKKYRASLHRLQQAASNAYLVSHNGLTHLLARDSFKNTVRNAIIKVEKSKSGISETQDISSPRVLSILAIDIDHFKQINDTWGHLYGDQVLKTLASRFEACARRIRTSSQDIEIHLGHPSGEEFLVLICANVEKEQIIEWGNEFRRCIADEVLPNNAEWSGLTTGGGVSISPPPLHERSVTISVGIATHNVAYATTNPTDPVSDLLDRADTALYKSKASGRNIVISYDDILSRFGRVLEHDTTAGVTVLDIGSNVGVAIGQEFRVYSPTYSGQKKFQINDGRTTRTLGIYPKVELTRIVAFDVQPELSFAYIDVAQDSSIAIEVGSHVESIPTGSIGHLLASSSRFFRTGRDLAEKNVALEVQNFLESASKEEGTPFAIFVRFSNESVFLKKYGSVAFNAALAHLYQEAKASFSTAEHVEVIDKGAVCIAGRNANYQEEVVTDFVKKMALDLSELGVVAGVCCNEDFISLGTADGQALPGPSKIFEFARFAASDPGRKPQDKVRHFGHQVAQDALQALRTSQSFEIANTDYVRLISLGVVSASIHNLGGIIASSLGKLSLAMDRYKAAIEISPDFLVYRSNFATVAIRTGEIEAGINMLESIAIDSIKKLRTVHPLGYFSYAVLLATAKISGSPSYVESRFLAIANSALELEAYKNNKGNETIKEALSMIKPTAD